MMIRPFASKGNSMRFKPRLMNKTPRTRDLKDKLHLIYENRAIFSRFKRTKSWFRASGSYRLFSQKASITSSIYDYHIQIISRKAHEWCCQWRIRNAPTIALTRNFRVATKYGVSKKFLTAHRKPSKYFILSDWSSFLECASQSF